MKQILTTLCSLLAVASVATAGTSSPTTSGKACNSCNSCEKPAADDMLGVGIGASYTTHYYFRGIQLGEDYLQGAVNFSTGLTENVRLDLDASYGFLADDKSVLNDLVGTKLSYERLELGAAVVATLGQFDVGLNYRWYHHDGDLGAIFEDSHEVGLTASTKVGMVTLGLGAYYDVTNEGWYFDAKASTEIKICKSFSLVPSVGIGYATDYDWQLVGDVGKLDGFTAVTVALAAPIKVCKNVTITPFIAANLPVDALKDAGEDNQVYGGVSVTIKF